jgi:hypothetical protein
MRTVHWLFAVSVALFIAGIGFIVAAGRMRQTVAVDEAPAAVAIRPVASVKQIMQGIVGPASTAVFNSVSTTVTDKGVEEVAPRNDEEWTSVGNQAAALAEAGNLMMIDGRAVDKADWVKMSQAMIDAARQTLKAVDQKSADGLLAAGEPLNASCDGCHQRYMRQ